MQVERGIRQNCDCGESSLIEDPCTVGLPCFLLKY